MKLRKLIENQTIRIDNHHRGDGCPLDWGSKSGEIHIHKIVNESGNCYEFKVPLNTRSSVSSTDFDIMPRRIKKEIMEAFQDSLIRQEFIKSLYDVLTDYHSIVSNERKAFDALLRICKFFKLENKTDQFVTDLREYVVNFSEEDTVYIAKMTKEAITVGQKAM